MKTESIIALYCFVDESLKSFNHHEDKRRKMNDSEVITTALVASLFFHGRIENARLALYDQNLIPEMLSKSRLNRRLHAVHDLIMQFIFEIGTVIKDVICDREYVLDSFPVSVCENIRIPNSRIFRDDAFRGYKSSMKRYFYGVKVHMITNTDGIPVETYFVPGNEHDVQILKRMDINLPPESKIYTDAAYTDYSVEDQLKEIEGVILKSERKKNSKRPDTPSGAFIKSYLRKGIETCFSRIKDLMPKNLRVVTYQGFLLKLTLFILGYQLKKLEVA